MSKERFITKKLDFVRDLPITQLLDSTTKLIQQSARPKYTVVIFLCFSKRENDKDKLMFLTIQRWG